MIKKAILLISILIVCMLAGNAIIYLGLKLANVDINELNIDNLGDILSGDKVSPSYLKILLALNSIMSFVLSAFLYLWLIKERDYKKYFNLEEEVNLYNLFLCLGLLFCSLPIAAQLGIWSMNIDFPDWMAGMDEDSFGSLSALLQMNGFTDFLITFILVAVIAGLGEELVFRGIIQNELQKIFKKSWIAIIITAILFSAVHFQPSGFLTKFIIGLVLGYVYWVSKNLWYSIFLHTLNNGMPIVFLYLNNNKIPEQELSQNQESIPWLVLILSLVVSINIIFTLQKKFADEPKA
jgi:membrane protease YdiL (CAAX protease family)